MGNKCMSSSNQPRWLSIIVHLKVDKSTNRDLYNHKANTLQISQQIFELDKNCLFIKSRQGYFIVQNISEYQQINKQNVISSIDFTFTGNNINIGNYRFAKFNFDFCDINSYIWIDVNQKMEIQPSDIIKISQYVIKYQEIILQQNLNAVYKLKSTKSIKNLGQVFCKICFLNHSFENPLIIQCNCVDSMKYIHINCLRQKILKSNKIKITKNTAIIQIKQLFCSACNLQYLKDQQNDIISILFAKNLKAPYIKLQLIKSTNILENVIIIHSFANSNETIIGRHKNLEICLDGLIGISMHQFKLIFDKQHYSLMINDEGSTFGTQILLKNNITINYKIQEKRVFQVGNCMLKFENKISEINKINNDNVKNFPEISQLMKLKLLNSTVKKPKNPFMNDDINDLDIVSIKLPSELAEK